MTTSRERSPIRSPPTVEFPVVSSPLFMEEEEYPWYDPDTWYPVHIGAVFKSRYQVLVKLGYGSASTAWLCRDLEGHCYMTLKVFEQKSAQAATEKAVYAHLETVRSHHPGQQYVRKLKDSFELPWKEGMNQCLVFDALAANVKDVRERTTNNRLPKSFTIGVIYAVLQALDFLHTRAHVIHTDLTDGNVMLSTPEESYFDAIVEEEWSDPMPRKLEGDRVVYHHRAVDIPSNPGPPILCDFGQAIVGSGEHRRIALPDLYRSPEMVLGIPWKEKIDIWAVGCMFWDLFEGKHLFIHMRGALDEEGFGENDGDHLARIIALLGVPPGGLLDRAVVPDRYFDNDPDGNFWFCGDIPHVSLEGEEDVLQGEEKASFLRFISRCLQWRPEDRSSAAELVRDPLIAMVFGKPTSEAKAEH
ncbi:kinase-like protein [Rhizodiscina lignyota]|uniref:non-specific serine/threonine protein kinase n=1 Tax=Rhizodiscina lignyota TaxID=1504668 RepID=A0A9P4IEH6_9PEZI|nr:kinase-like protein [Rhizodiscina lignyota]